ncbi:hypothetical protein JTB14_031283 [Gonioctena quinquepunctata]|nr:hypothetical protein JTB14_031283 [Gonioctena quinquepunctata]
MYMVYMDNIIIFSTGLQEHFQNLKLVFTRMHEDRLKIKLDQCEFLKKEVEFLGHVVTPDGMKPNSKNRNSENVQFHLDTKSFLGLFRYYRKSIENFAKITEPMTSCLKKDKKVEHTEEFLECFDT